MAESQTVTVLVTDLVASTATRVRLGEIRADRLRRTHDEIMRLAITASNGTIIKGLGDGVLALFNSAADAVSAAVAIQQAAYSHTRTSPDEPLEIRVGLSSGDVTLEDGDCFGTPVIEASRLCASALEGQILAADLVRMLARGRGEHTFVAAGERELKGLPEPVPVVVVGWSPPSLQKTGLAFPNRLVNQGALPFSGRSDQVSALLEAWSRARDGVRQAVFVSGEPGIGKTRLSSVVARAIYDQGGLVLLGRCDENVRMGFQPVVDILEQYLHSEPPAEALGRYGGDLSRLVPDISQRVAGLGNAIQADPETVIYRLFDAVASWLASMSRDDPVLVIIDDLHWAEKPTLLLLRHLLRSPEPMRLLLIATYRDTEVNAANSLVEILADLNQESGVENLHLSGLNLDEVTEMLAKAAGNRLDPRALAMAEPLWSETEGNPFFVQEVILSLVESGHVVQRDGVWTTDFNFEDFGIPEGVRQAIGRRLARLGDAENSILLTASVIGPVFDVGLIAEVTGLARTAVVDALDAASGAALVQERSAGSYEFTHALVRSTLYDRLSATRRAMTHLEIAEAMEKRPDADPATLAFHFRRTVPVDRRAITFAEKAGSVALEHLAFDQAVTLFTQAIDIGNELGFENRLRCHLMVRLGNAQRLAGNPAHRETLLSAARLAKELGDVDLMAAAVLANNRGIISAAGVVDDERVAALKDALEAVGEHDSPARARILATLATELIVREPRPDLSDEAVAIARRLGDERCLLEVLRAHQIAAATPERITDLVAGIPELLELAERVGDAQELVLSCLWGCQHYTEVADVERARALLARAGVVAKETNNPTFNWLVAGFAVPQALLSGGGDDVEAAALEAYEIGSASGQPDAFLWFASQLVWAREKQGRLGELVDVIKEQVTVNTSITALLRTAVAFMTARSGRLDETREVLDEMFESPDDPMPSDPTWLLGHVSLGVAIHAAGTPEQAEREYELLLPYAGRLTCLVMVHGFSVNLSLALLAMRAGWPEIAERHFAETLSQDESLGALVRPDRTRYEWGRFLIERGEMDRARDLLTAARRGAEAHGALDIAAGVSALMPL